MKLINSLIVFSFLLFIALSVSAYGPTHPSVNTVVAGGPYICSGFPSNSWSDYVPGTCSGSDIDLEGFSISFMNWMNEHIDYQYWGKTMLARYYNRNQPLGEYYVIQSDIFGSPRYNDLINYFQSRGLNPEDAFTHWNKNTVQTAVPPPPSPPISYLMPGWDPLNDPNGDYTRNWNSDYSKTSGDFTINYSSNSITHSGKNWTPNQWQGDIVRLGWGSFDDTKIDFTVASNTSNTIYVLGTIPNRTYLYYFVDDKDAPNHNAVAKIKFDSRMYAHGWSSGSPSADFSGIRFDISNENVRNWTAGYLSNLLKAQREGPNAYNGPLSVQEDDIKLGLGGDDQFKTDISWTEIQNRILEPGMKNSPNLNFTNSLKLTYQKTRQSMTANVSGISYLCGNIGGRVGSYPDRMDPIIEEMDCIFNEGFVSTQWGAFATLKTGLEKYQAWGKMSFVHASTGLDRIYSLAAYYIVKDANTYYMYDTNPDYGVRLGNPDNWWYGLMEVDIGMPSGPATTITVGSSQAWQRDFTKGKVFLKPTGNGITMAINLGGSYYRLDVSGNPIGGAITSLTLNEGEGAVLIPAGQIPLCSSAGGTCYSNVCSSYSSCSSVNGSCSPGYCCTGACTGANVPPVVSQVQCERNTSNNWVACSTLAYNDLLLRVRASCTDSDGSVVSARFSLLNVPDSNTIFNQSATLSSGYWVYDNADLRLNDSGQFNLVTSCTDNLGGTGSSTVSWTLPWGKLMPSLITPISDSNVVQNTAFTFTSKVDCIGGECGSLSATLDPTVTFQDGLNGYAGCQDTLLKSEYATRNYGAASSEEFGVISTGSPLRLLIQFKNLNITGTVQSAKIQMFLVDDYSSQGNKTWSVHKVLVDWIEGAGTPREAIAGEACWQYRSYASDAWSGCDPNNVYCSTSIESSPVFGSDNGGLGVWVDIPVSNATVQGWINNPSSNHGVMVKLASETGTAEYTIDLCEAQQSLRPKLVITYSSTGGAKGAVSTVVGAQPFYTTSSNPQTNCSNLKGSQSCTNIWSVVPTGSIASRWEFYTEYFSTTYPSNVDSNQSRHVFLTIDSGSCTSGQTRQCGPSTDVGICEFGTQTCTSGTWGSCIGAVYPQTEICSNGTDEDCSGADLACSVCPQGQITSRCLCEGTAYGSGYCCSNVYQATPCTQNACSDGTPINLCSANKPLYCDSNAMLSSKCSQCGCPNLTDACNADGTCTAQCIPNWQCGDWSSCLNGNQTRTCTDANCNSAPRTETQSCGVCTPGQTQSCTVDNCTGSQTCSNQGAWGSCVKADLCCGLNCNDNNDCTTDSCSGGACSNIVIPNCGSPGPGPGPGPSQSEFLVELYPSEVNVGAKFTVTVKDSSTKSPVENASVTYAKATQYTNSSGQTEFTAIEGYSLVTVKKDGYKNKTVRITVIGQEPSSLCGNNVCDLGESHGNCPQDCPKGKKPSLRISTETPTVLSGQTIDVTVTLDNGSAVPDATVVYAGKTYTTDSEGIVALTAVKGFNSVTARANDYEPGAMLLKFITAKAECGNTKCEEGEDTKSCPMDCVGEKPFDLLPFTAGGIALILIVFFVVVLISAKHK